jgi:5-methylthioadenosine/S-adenosylhomocysteine deaminase
MRTAGVVIIGGGIVGVSLAYHLARRGSSDESGPPSGGRLGGSRRPPGGDLFTAVRQEGARVATLRIDGGTVITMDGTRRILLDGAVAIDGDRIVAVGKRETIAPAHPAPEVLDARGKLVLPGLVNTHLHHVQTLARGLGDDVDGNTWAYKRIWPYEVVLTEEDAYASALLSCLEMIRTGSTCAADPGGYRMDGVGRALEESGVRGILAWAGMDRYPSIFVPPDGLPGKTDTAGALGAMEGVVRRWHGRAGGRIRGAYGVRIDVNASPELLEDAHRLAERDGVLVEMHTQTNQARLAWMRETLGHSTIELLESRGLLGPRWLLIHCVHLTNAEVELLHRRDARVSHNPGASTHGCYGAFSRGKFPEMIAKGVTVGLGCDSTAANNSLDMFRAMNLAATVHKEVRLVPDLIVPEKALEMATIDAARAIGWDDEIGSLEAGKKADVIVVDARRPNLVPAHPFSIVPNLVYSGDGADVETTIVDGRVLMEERRFLTLDPSAVLDRAQSAAERIVRQLPYPEALRPRWPVS